MIIEGTHRDMLQGEWFCLESNVLAHGLDLMIDYYEEEYRIFAGSFILVAIEYLKMSVCLRMKKVKQEHCE